MLLVSPKKVILTPKTTKLIVSSTLMSVKLFLSVINNGIKQPHFSLKITLLADSTVDNSLILWITLSNFQLVALPIQIDSIF